MIARIFTVAGQQVALLAAQPNWATEVTLALDLPTDIEKEAITLTEARRNFAQSARYTMKWTTYLSNAADSTELRIFLTRVRGESIICPLWTDQCEFANAVVTGQRNILLIDTPARFGASWIVTDSTFTNFEIVSVTGINLATNTITLSVGLSQAYPAGTYIFPLMAGRLTERPKPESITDETMEAAFTLKESSTFAARVTPAAASLQTVGANVPAFATLPKWNIAPNFVKPLDWTEMPDIVYETVGFLRQDQQRVYDHRNARGIEYEFFENNRADIAKIEYFWRDRRANTLRFMVPTWRGDLRMSLDTPNANFPTHITCEPSYFTNPGREAQPGDPYIAIIDANNVVWPYQLSRTIDDPASSTLVATQNVDIHKGSSCILSHLMLARFADAKLEWAYTTPYLGTTRIKFQELPNEYANTPVANKEPAYLFIFTEIGVRVDRFTSYENTVVISDNGVYRGTYVPAPFSFDKVKVGLKLEAEKLQFKSFKFDGNPLNKLWPFALDGVLTLEVVEVDVNRPASSTAMSRFYGDVTDVDSDYKATAVPFARLFDRKFPRFLLSISDNYVQFSPPTKITPSAFAISATMPTVIDTTSQTVIVTSVTGFAKAQSWFGGGWLETGTGVNFERRGILDSVPTGTNQVTLYIDRPLLKSKPGQALTIYPGYDGSIDQCDTKFNNRINFGGQPYIPDVNPGVKAMKAKQTAGGKKA